MTTSAPAPGFRIGPLTHYADTAAMAAWLEAAAPGDVIVYATGPMLADHPAPKLARRWHGAGQVDLFQTRAERAHCFEYKARKRATASAAVPPAASSAEILPGEALRVLEMLSEAATANECCPTNDAIARTLGLKDWKRARYRFGQLVSAGRIRVIEPARFGARVIEIVSSGARTAPSEAADQRRRA